MYGQVSLGMKKSNIITIQKEGDKQTVKNYRSVSLLPL